MINAVAKKLLSKKEAKPVALTFCEIKEAIMAKKDKKDMKQQIPLQCHKFADLVNEKLG